MPNPIVLFGGTFDPVHHGHLIAARAVAEHCGYTRVTLVPSASPPHKVAAGAAAADRLAMLRLAIEGEGLFDLSDVELRRSGPSYTYDTLEHSRQHESPGAEVHLVIGMDMLAELPSWHRAAEVAAMARIVVAARPPWQGKAEEVLAVLRGRFEAAATAALADAVVPTPLVDISSTDVRRRVAAGLSIRFLVPEAVRNYIEQRGLYAAHPRGKGRPVR